MYRIEIQCRCDACRKHISIEGIFDTEYEAEMWRFETTHTRRLCDDCKRKEGQGPEKDYGLPDFIGSDKEIRWATFVYRLFLDDLAAMKPKMWTYLNASASERYISNPSNTDHLYRYIQEFAKENYRDANFWIKNRNNMKKFIKDTIIQCDAALSKL